MHARMLCANLRFNVIYLAGIYLCIWRWKYNTRNLNEICRDICMSYTTGKGFIEKLISRLVLQPLVPVFRSHHDLGELSVEFRENEIYSVKWDGGLLLSLCTPLFTDALCHVVSISNDKLDRKALRHLFRGSTISCSTYNDTMIYPFPRIN